MNDRQMMLELAAAIAVALGTPKADVDANLAAAYPAEPVPDQKPTDKIGHAREVKGGEFVDYEIRADGTRHEVGRGVLDAA